MPDITAPSGIRWHYHIDGEGPVLLFLHGWGVDHRIWRQQMKHFAPYFRIMAIDLPGHGQSSWQQVPLLRMAEDIHWVLQSLDIGGLMIVGSSLGGLLALKMYAVDNAPIHRLIFVGSMPKFVRSEDYPYGLSPDRVNKLSGQLNSDYPSIVNIFFRSLFTREERMTRRYKWLQKFRRTDVAPARPALARYLDILCAEDLRSVLQQVQVPIQFINGTHDEICCRQTVKYLQTLCPEARFDDFENSGHFPFLSRPLEFNDVMEDFLLRDDETMTPEAGREEKESD